jgi:hypothetical protein
VNVAELIAERHLARLMLAYASEKMPRKWQPRKEQA